MIMMVDAIGLVQLQLHGTRLWILVTKILRSVTHMLIVEI